MFTVGQKVCLWKVSHQPQVLKIIVIREVVVMISEIKIGVPSTVDGRPVRFQSLRAVDTDGALYEKHWTKWPESQSDDFSHQWSPRDEGEVSGLGRYWIPCEAVNVYNDAMRRKNQGYKLVDSNGNEVVPTGEVFHCARHNRYVHVGFECFLCLADGRKF